MFSFITLYLLGSQEPNLVPREDCRYVPWQCECENLPRQQCHTVHCRKCHTEYRSVTNYVDEQKCHTEQDKVESQGSRQDYHQEPRQECKQVPRQKTDYRSEQVYNCVIRSLVSRQL